MTEAENITELDECPFLPPSKTNLGIWEAEWKYDNLELGTHSYKLGSVCSDDPRIPVLSRWMISLDGSDDNIVGVELEYIDGLTDEELVALMRKGARAAQLEAATLRVLQLVEDFEGGGYELWTIDEFQSNYEEDYEFLCRHHEEPDVAGVLSRFEPIWRGDTPNAGYIYCLSDHQGHYKLGRTKQLQTRIKALATQPPFKIQLLFTHYVFNAALYEKRLHRIFAHKRMNGEWFGLDEKDLESIKTGNWANNYR
jgi:hypothetical protein